MKLLINVSGTPLTKMKYLKDYSNYSILSPYKGAKTLGAKKWFAIPYSYRKTDSLNRAFWMANYFIDNKIENFDEIQHVRLLYSNNKEKKFGVKNMRIPVLSHYFSDTSDYLTIHESLDIWKAKKDNKIDMIIEKYKSKESEKFKPFVNRIIRVYKNKNKRIINGGNEGILYFKNDSHKTIIKESMSFDAAKLKVNQNSKEIFGCKVLNAIGEIQDFYNFEIKNISKNIIKFEFDNVLLPTGQITYSMLINSLIKQRDMKILIDDNKIENYAKYHIGDSTISRRIFADIGIAFLKFKNDNDYNKNLFGIIRDNYYLGKNHKHHNCRQIIRDRRVFNNIDSIDDPKFKIFHDIVMNGYKDENNACHLKELPKYGKWKFCKHHVNTISKSWDKKEDKYLKLKNLYEDELVDCNCKNLLSEIKDMNIQKTYEYDDTLSYINDGWEVDFGPKIIAMVTTTGNRDINKALSSIENQTQKVDEIVIASEKKIKNNYKTYINQYQNGLARNTMQALVKIRKENVGKVYIATLDDDDEWKHDYIENAKTKFDKSTFITSPLEVFVEGVFEDVWDFKDEDLNIETFLYGNCGVQGSNKIFDLDIALESGGMPKNINASTDRAFNINMLLHPETKVSVLDKPLVIFNMDKRTDRITNNPKRLGELRKFYKHFWALIDTKNIDKINERHKKIHGFEKVITWE